MHFSTSAPAPDGANRLPVSVRLRIGQGNRTPCLVSPLRLYLYENHSDIRLAVILLITDTLEEQISTIQLWPALRYLSGYAIERKNGRAGSGHRPAIHVPAGTHRPG